MRNEISVRRFWYCPGAWTVKMTANDIVMPLPWIEITEEMFWDFINR